MRPLFLLCLVYLLAPDADAQRRLSGRAGVVFATFADVGDSEASPYIAPTAGLAIRFPLTRAFDAEVDLSVLPRGARLSREGSEASFRYSYFDLSLLGRAYLDTRSRLHVGAFAGPTLSLLLQEAFEDEVGQVRVDGFSKGTVPGITVGATVGYRDVRAEVRYVGGTGSFVEEELRTFEDVLTGETRERAYTHRALVLSLGLRL